MRYAVAHLANHGVFYRSLLGGSGRAAAARLEVLEDHVVREHVDRKLLVAELVETGHLVTGRGADFVGDLFARREHGDHGRLELGLCESQPLQGIQPGRAVGENSEVGPVSALLAVDTELHVSSRSEESRQEVYHTHAYTCVGPALLRR